MTEQHREIGTLLRQGRERLGMELRQVAIATNIRLRYLQALEDGNMSDLPGGIYTKGFVHQYAQYLRLNVADIMHRYDAAGMPSTPNATFYIPVPTRQENTPGRGMLMISAALVLGLALYWKIIQNDDSAVVGVQPLPPEMMELIQVDFLGALSASNCLIPHAPAFPPCFERARHVDITSYTQHPLVETPSWITRFVK